MKMLISILIIGIFSSAIALCDEKENYKMKCAELGQVFTTEFKKEYFIQGLSIWGNPEFHYNRVLGTCLVYTEITDGLLNNDIDSVWYYRRITDVYSNRVLAYSRYLIFKKDPTKKETLADLINVGDAVNLSSERFDIKKAELFGQ